MEIARTHLSCGPVLPPVGGRGAVTGEAAVDATTLGTQPCRPTAHAGCSQNNSPATCGQ